MKRLFCIVVALVLLVSGFAFADYEEKLGVGALLVTTSTDMEDGSVMGFEGQPSDEIAWIALCEYANNYIEGIDRLDYTKQELDSIYSLLFAGGALSEDPPECSFERLETGEYRFYPGDSNATRIAAINRETRNSDGSVDYDASIYSVMHVDGDERFIQNLTAVVEPDERSAFGGRVRSMNITETSAFAPNSASATAELKPASGNTYVAGNAIDGKPETCWSYDGKKDADATMTLTFDEPTDLRGIVFTPGYAKSEDAFKNNRRIKELEVNIGTKYISMPVGEDMSFEMLVVIPFGEVLEGVTDIGVRVIETYPGEKYDDVCISEISFF